MGTLACIDPIPMPEVFHVIGGQADDVVYTALQHRHAASDGACSALNAATDRTLASFDGLCKPSRAQPNMLASPLEHQLRHHHFPGIALKTVPVLRFRALPVPCDDGQNRAKRATHTVRGLETTSEEPNDRPFAI